MYIIIFSYLYICRHLVFEGIGKDARIGRRLNKFATSMIERGTSIVNRCSSRWAEIKASYRLLSNDRLKIEDMIECITNDGCMRSAGMAHVLCIQDTSEFCYDSNKGRLSLDDNDLGYGNNQDEEYCIYAHPTLMVDAASHMPVGFSSMKIYNHDRSDGRRKRCRRRSLPLNEKESFRWAESAQNTAACLPREIKKTMVGDRESDVYSVMYLTLESGCDFLIRSMHNRCVGEDMTRLAEHMKSVGVSGTYTLDVRGKKGRKSRKAEMELKYDRVEIHKARQCADDVPDTIECYCIHAKERASTVPEGEEPIEWRLLTSHEVSSDAQAMQCIEWYKCRWFIEELFRVCKRDGFDVESSRLNTGIGLKKLIVMTLYASLHCMSLKLAFDDGNETQPATIVFDRDEMELLSIENTKLKEMSPKANVGGNPFKEKSLAWAAWIIARLGNWHGYVKAFGLPGYITMKRGMDVFHMHYDIFILLRQKDVGKK